MVKPGIHFGMSMQEYLSIPAVSNGVLRTLLERCQAAAWHCSPFNPNKPRDDTDASDAGTIAHEIFLEGSRDCLRVIDPKDHPNLTKPFATPDGWTNKPMREAKAAARAAGKIPVLPSDVAEIDALVCAAQRFVDSLRTTEPAIHAMMQPDGGKSEVVMVWEEGETLCKLRADRIATDYRLLLDYKSTALSAEPQAWSRTMLDYHGRRLVSPRRARCHRRRSGLRLPRRRARAALPAFDRRHHAGRSRARRRQDRLRNARMAEVRSRRTLPRLRKSRVVLRRSGLASAEVGRTQRRRRVRHAGRRGIVGAG
jgi:hypothetical protein